jgi:hypothetical protein
MVDTPSKNPYSVRYSEWCANEGLETAEAVQKMMTHFIVEGKAPALCSEECEVEPDGVCSHGCKSVLLAVGLI